MNLSEELILAESDLGKIPLHLSNMHTFHRGAMLRIEQLRLAMAVESQRSCGLMPFDYGSASGHCRVIAASPDRNELSVLESMVASIEGHPDFPESEALCVAAFARVTELRQAVADAEHERISRIDQLAQAERAALAAAQAKAERDPKVLAARDELAKFTAEAPPEPIALVRGRVKLATDAEPELQPA